MKYLIIFLTIMFSFSLQAQEKGSIRGKVLDTELYNEPLLMANISLKGTTWNTRTNFNGNFEITDITPGNYIMKISFLGYEDVSLPIVVSEDNTTYINQSLKAKTVNLTDVVETDFGSNKKNPITTGLE